MISSKTPVRIEIGGGATDVEPYCSDYSGYVINVTIDYFFRSILNKREDKSLQIFSNDTFTAYKFKKLLELTLKQAQGDLVKAIFYYLKPQLGLDVYLHGEPPQRAGLGASASLSTSLISGIIKIENRPININQIAEMAYNVEDKILKNIGGRQDQYASVYGGFNEMEFLGGAKVRVEKLNLSKSYKEYLEKNLILYYTRDPHKSGNLVGRQVESYQKNKQKATQYLDELKEIAYQMRDSLLEEDMERFGKLLTKDWKVKTEFNPLLTTDFMRELNDLVMKNGGIGGRVCGAGGGGCFIWLVEPKKRVKITTLLEEYKGKLLNYHFIEQGLEITQI